MRIAIGKKDPATGRYVFPVAIPFLAPCTLEMEKTGSTNDRAPTMRLLLNGENCGALWKREARGASGESFLSGSIESPAFPGARLDIAVFHSKDQAGTLDMTWRPLTGDRTEASAPAPAAAPRAPQAEGDDDIPF